MNETSALILQIYRASRELAVDEFQDFVLGIVRSVIPFTSSRWVTADIPGGRKGKGFVRYVHIQNEPEDTAAEWEAVSHQDRLKELMLANPGRAMTICAPLFYDKTADADIREYARRYGHVNTLSMILPTSVRDQWEALSLYRPDAAHQYRQEERQIFQGLTPHLTEALVHNRLHSFRQAGVAADEEASALAITQSDGIPHYIGNAFFGLLQSEWPDWNGHRLPQRLQEALVRTGSPGFSGKAIAVTVTRLGNLMLLRASRHDPLRPLTQREALVARLYGQGHSYKEIARQIGVSPATVRVFLHRVYGKLHISDKAQLASLLARRW